MASGATCDAMHMDRVDEIDMTMRTIGPLGLMFRWLVDHVTAEQRRGIGEVSQAIGHVGQVAQQNAALVEQSAAASASLSWQAKRMVEAVSVFPSCASRELPTVYAASDR